MSVDPVVSILWDVLKRVAVPIKRRFGYVISSKSYAQDLQKEVGKLADEADRIHIAVEGARTIHRDISPWVPEFMASAEEASKEAKDLLREFHGASKSCCRGTIPDPKCRYQFSRKAKSKTDDIQKLIRENKDKAISFNGPVAYAADLRQEVRNLDREYQRVRNAAEEARTNLHDIHEWVPKFLASAEKASEEAKELLGSFEATIKSCCYGTLPDPNCRSQFIGEAKSKTDHIKNLILENSGSQISSKGPAAYAADLRKEVRDLENEAKRVGVLETKARYNARNVRDDFTTWKANAEEALKEARDLLGDLEGASKSGCHGTLPDSCGRDEFNTKARAQIVVVRELAQQCSIQFKGSDDVFRIPAPGDVTASTSTNLRDDGVFQSRASVIKEIMDALADDTKSVVGVHGMGGVGKSTLLVYAERRIREQKSFDWVAKADVSENPDIKTIQGDIADALGLTDIKNKETISGRAKLLHDRLMDEERQKKKVLIILDNLWAPLDLKSVGIPCGDDNKAKGCKLLLTSRDHDVLQSGMGCDKAFHLGGLQAEEARALFERIVGDKVHDDEFKPLGDELLLGCAGVPFQIVQMAKPLKHAPLYKWEDTLKRIEMSKDRGIKKPNHRGIKNPLKHAPSFLLRGVSPLLRIRQRRLRLGKLVIKTI